MRTLADVIADAREYIEKHGWWRGALVGPNGKQVCTLGGIYNSQGWNGHTEHHKHHAEIEQINNFVIQALLSKHPDGYLTNVTGMGVAKIADISITDWNDHFAVDKQDVLDTLAKAEKIMRAGFDPDA